MCTCVSNADRRANSVDPNQKEQSNLGLHCLPKPQSLRKPRIITLFRISEKNLYLSEQTCEASGTSTGGSLSVPRSTLAYESLSRLATLDVRLLLFETTLVREFDRRNTVKDPVPTNGAKNGWITSFRHLGSL